MISLYEKTATSFSDNGICVLNPTVCVVHEVSGGEYELELEHPMDNNKKFMMLSEERLIKAPVPPTTIPQTVMPQLDVLKTNKQTNLYSKLPVSRHKNNNWQIIDMVYHNQAAYTWASHAYYNAGAIVLQESIVYRANRGNYNISPKTDFFVWAVLGPLTDANPVIDSGTVLETLASNTTVYKVADVAGSYLNVRTQTGKVGFVLKSDCTTTTEHYQQTIDSYTIDEQIFRIYEVSCDEESQTCSVRAKHISYDFARNCLYDCKLTEAKPNEAIAAIQGALMEDDDRTIATNITSGKITKDWSFKNPINALLDPENGLVKLLEARLIRDNEKFYILDYSTPNKGITIEYGVNMLGVNWTRSIENVVTRIIPRSGDSKKGYLYIDNGGRIQNGSVHNDHKNYVESANADYFASPIISVLNCSYQVGQEYEKPDGTKTKYDEATVKQKMLTDAKEKFTKDAVDGVDITLDVEFLLLGDTEEYKQYRGLQSVTIYDIITVKTGKSEIEAEARLIEYEYDCLLRRYNSIKLGSVSLFKRRVPGYRIVNESVTYDKLSPDLINRILTDNASESTDSGGGGSTPGGDSTGLGDMNTKDTDGIVKKGSNGGANKVWKTDANGNPDWRDESVVSVTDGDPTLAWGTRSKVGTVAGTDLHVTMPNRFDKITITAQTNSNGIITYTKSGAEALHNKIPVAAYCTSHNDCICLLGYHSTWGCWIKVQQHNGTVVGETTVTIDVYY